MGEPCWCLFVDCIPYTRMRPRLRAPIVCYLHRATCVLTASRGLSYVPLDVSGGGVAGIGVHLSPNEDYLTLRDNLIGHMTQKKGQYAVKCIIGGEEDASTALARYANLKPPSKAQPLTVWHRRLCHLGIRNVVKLARQAEGVIISRDRQDNSPAICEHC